MAAKKSGGRKYGKSASKSVGTAMKRRKKGTLKRSKGGRGGTVKSRKQAIAIGLNEARKKGAKVPARKKSSAKKSSAKKSSSKRSSAKKSSSRRKSSAKKTGGRKRASKRSS
jgi:hypothetical protein